MVLQLSSVLDPCEKLEAITEISVGCCPKTKTKPSFYNSTRYGGDGVHSYWQDWPHSRQLLECDSTPLGKIRDADGSHIWT